MKKVYWTAPLGILVILAIVVQTTYPIERYDCFHSIMYRFEPETLEQELFTRCTLEEPEYIKTAEKTIALLTYSCDEGSFMIGAHHTNDTFSVQTRSPSYRCDQHISDETRDVSELPIERFIYDQHVSPSAGYLETYGYDPQLRGGHRISFCTSVVEAYDLNGSFTERFESHRLDIERCRSLLRPP